MLNPQVNARIHGEALADFFTLKEPRLKCCGFHYSVLYWDELSYTFLYSIALFLRLDHISGIKTQRLYWLNALLYLRAA